MKRTIAILLCCVMLCGCTAPAAAPTGAPVDEAAIKKAGYDEGYSAGFSDGVASVTAQKEDLSQNVADETVASAPVIEDKVAPEIGVRKNPAKIGEPVEFAIDTYYAKGVAEIELAEVIDGSEAWDIIHEENMFNDEAGPGMRYVIARFNISFVEDRSGKDEPLELNWTNFKCASEDYSVTDTPSVAFTDSMRFDVKLYEGASSGGWVAFLFDENDVLPFAVFCDTVWFSLSK